MTVADFVPARRENIRVMVGFAGASQSGKTYSAMLIADALAGDLPFAMSDSENGRGRMYADDFPDRFEHADLTSPFTPASYLAKAMEFTRRGFPVNLIDSMSHEWAGVGGVLEMAEKSTVKSPGNWAKPKAEHKKMMDGFLRADCHLVFCLRAHEKIKIEKVMVDGREKTVVLPLGWMPVCEKNFIYEMTVSFTMHPDHPGVIDYSLPHKCPDPLKPIFRDGHRITREMGLALAEWARGGGAVHPDIELWRVARNEANQGTVRIRDHMHGLSDGERERLAPIRRELWDTAKRADANAAGAPLPSDAPAPESQATGAAQDGVALSAETAAEGAGATNEPGPPSADDYEEQYLEDDERDEGAMAPLDNQSAEPSADDRGREADDPHDDQQQGGLGL